MKEYFLKGSTDNHNIDRRISLFSTLLQQAEHKITHISELRQRNMNYAIVIFAALFTFTMKYPKELYSGIVSFALLLIIGVFCFLDRRLHKIIHGWNMTKKELVERVNDIINQPAEDITYLSYWSEGEKSAERYSLQPMIFYFLIAGSIIHLIYLGIIIFNK